MNHTLSPDIKQLMDVVNYRPAVSLIMPFEVKMGLKNEVMRSLKIASEKIERELYDNYSAEVASLIMEKLRNCIQKLNFNTHKNSIAIYVSPVFEKVFYMEIPVEEKIIIDESFEIRDLVYAKKELHKYLLLLLSANGSRLFLGNSDSFIKIVSNTPESVYASLKNPPEKVANFTAASEHKELLMDKFLNHVDNTLDIILKAYPLPLFVLGTERIAGHFKKITRHAASVVEYVHGNYDETPQPQLRKILEPYINDWKQVKQKSLLKQLEEAAGKNKLAAGIKNVWKEATNKKGRLLAVEKNYMCAVRQGGREDIIYQENEPANRFSVIKDVVDDIIEKVLENGGDVEFTDEGVLKAYHHIALIQYF